MPSRQNILIGLVIVLALGVAYIYFFPNSTEQPLSTTPPASPAEQQFLDLAAKLTPISFDTAIFADPRFTALVDLRTSIAPEIQGRSDPFSALPH